MRSRPTKFIVEDAALPPRLLSGEVHQVDSSQSVMYALAQYL